MRGPNDKQAGTPGYVQGRTEKKDKKGEKNEETRGNWKENRKEKTHRRGGGTQERRTLSETRRQVDKRELCEADTAKADDNTQPTSGGSNHTGFRMHLRYM